MFKISKEKALDQFGVITNYTVPFTQWREHVCNEVAWFNLVLNSAAAKLLHSAYPDALLTMQVVALREGAQQISACRGRPYASFYNLSALFGWLENELEHLDGGARRAATAAAARDVVVAVAGDLGILELRG